MGAAALHAPVRVLQCETITPQSASDSQCGKQPAWSGWPEAWVYQKPVHTIPARQPPAASPTVPGVQLRVQNVSGMTSPAARQVEGPPLHSLASPGPAPVSVHVHAQKPPATVVSHAIPPQSASDAHGPPATAGRTVTVVHTPDVQV